MDTTVSDTTGWFPLLPSDAVGAEPPDVVDAEVAFEVAVLAEDLDLQPAMTVPGLPLRLRDELHVRSDRSGVALRRVLAAFAGVEG